MVLAEHDEYLKDDLVKLFKGEEPSDVQFNI